MFQRRVKQSFLKKVGQVLWPRMGWRRTLAYFWHRLQRIPGAPSSIAAGFACGVSVAMTPFYGMHIVTAGLMAWAIRGNVFAAVLGAQAANPWTAAPLWFAAYYLGAWMIGINVNDQPPNFISMFKGLTEATLNLNFDIFRKSVWPIFWPMVLGSLPMGIIAGVVSYFALLPVLKKVQLRRITRWQSKQAGLHVALPPEGADV
jgi:uncharacterized protein